MPFRPQHSLLRVEVPALGTIDTSSVENLFGMWSLFSKTSHAMEDGRRLENLSWRLWNRETFCCNPQSQARSKSSTPLSISHKPKAAATDIPMPELSSSPDSVSSDEIEESETASPHAAATLIPKARPELRYGDSCESRSRGREKHITPVDLEKIVISIKETKELDPLPISLSIPAPVEPEQPISRTTTQQMSTLSLDTTSTTEQSSDTTTTRAPSISESQAALLESSASTVDTNDDKISESCGSEGSSNTETSGHSIVRGFIPGGAPSSYRSQTNLAAQPTPILKNSPKMHQARSKKKGAMFIVGTSSGEEESSLETHMFKSALSESLKRPSSNLAALANKKQTSFKEEVAVGRAAEHSPVFDESDDEDDEDAVSESAIDDDFEDSSDWEDSDELSAVSSVNENQMFQRVDSRPNLTSRRSLLTTLMHEPDRAKALANAASRSTPAMRRSRNTTPNGPSLATSPAEGAQIEMPNEERGRPIIMTTSNTHQAQRPLSPRTTRRNMLSTELTESLRKNLLWERQHKSTGNLAALKRRHTSNDVKNLKQHPEPGPVLSHGAGPSKLTNEYFSAGLGEYHAKGW